MKYPLSVFLLAALLMPQGAAYAALEVAGWIPWWQAEEGIESASDNLHDLDIIYPFVYEVDNNGKLVAKADLDDDEWDHLTRKAQRRDVLMMPSITWFDGDAIHRVLSDDDLREEHVKAIVKMVKDGGFDGVNIDYEQKRAATIDYFSEFLEDLKDELRRKKLSCTIEARTPPHMVYRKGEVPKNIQYANDYREMNRHCDWVEIMTYDQQRAILSLNQERQGEPYIPVADTKWVEAVIELALEDIDADKILLGVPTYGRQWTLTVLPDWYKEYKSVGAINLPDAEELAEEYGVTPGRNAAGEVSYSYFPEDSIFKILNSLPTPEGTRVGFEAAAKALLFANATGMSVPVNVVWYSDAAAIEEKVELAKKYNLKGVAIFKVDGEEDQDVWDLF